MDSWDITCLGGPSFVKKKNTHFCQVSMSVLYLKLHHGENEIIMICFRSAVQPTVHQLTFEA